MLNGKPEESSAVNNGIFRQVQLHIMATKRFILVYQHCLESCIPSDCNLVLLRTLHDDVLRGYRPGNFFFFSLSLFHIVTTTAHCPLTYPDEFAYKFSKTMLNNYLKFNVIQFLYHMLSQYKFICCSF